MTGVSDLPFRETATALGAPYVATEMVACAEFARGRPDVVRRAAVGEGLPLMVVQLVGRDPELMAQGARMAAEAGAQIIDLNFGCPAKEVSAGQQSGSALMREPDLAEALVAAAVAAVTSRSPSRCAWAGTTTLATPPTSRAGLSGRRQGDHRSWPHTQPVLQGRCRLVGRRRGQGGGLGAGAGQWRHHRRRHRAHGPGQSGADGVMIGRGVYGRPWIADGDRSRPRRSRLLSSPTPRSGWPSPSPISAAALSSTASALGLKMFRKHLASYIEAAPWPETPEARRLARADSVSAGRSGRGRAGIDRCGLPIGGSPHD
jgi:tRNA-dihydrouridine synthase B